MILTVDLGTSVTKVALWGSDGLLSMGRSRVPTVYEAGGRGEQEPLDWWRALEESARAAVAELRDGGTAVPDIDAVVFSSQRQTFVPVDDEGSAIGRAILWSDRRADKEVRALAHLLGGTDALWRRTGSHLDPGAVAAKVAWLAMNEPERLERARWLLSPRDLLCLALTGEVATDETLASASGLYILGEDPRGSLVLDRELAGALTQVAGEFSSGADAARAVAAAGRLEHLLPEPRQPQDVIGRVSEKAASMLGITPDVPVVLGGGDRPSEAIGSGASTWRPMVSWGTTANVSVPVADGPAPRPAGLNVTRSASSGWLLEGGLSAAGSMLEWLSALSGGSETREILESAAASVPGANGVVVLPWLGGARAPWWRPDAFGAILGLRPEHTLGDVARAAIEGVALDLARCLESVYRELGGKPTALALSGAGAGEGLWSEVISGVTGLPSARRRSGEAASVGAALIAADALGMKMDLERLNPVVSEVDRAPEAAECYRALRARSDAAAKAALVASEGGAHEHAPF